ncbi:Putative amino acid efflux protein YcgF [Planktothrix tepida]|uniref:Lysine exporter protein (LYSE/YGGA) n=2 Tax=Planktothrix TaxID=54304 RepID=A0A1J1LD89_9CYAN|nr:MULTISPECIES: LysE family transporter [Planktothrix]CAD5912236.1 Putative amino acid efflux protein YcgF [Planktothrix tepida]CAD5986644.1 Putative amino acid efflux protein YcgF [Planktothrix pseudagardhii]CUR30432.1 Lysine exporter protein (LYSE/YGGA) [Planktothrix tepida PCC 9214]
MDIRFLVKGLIIGFSIAAPVGPIGILCIRRSLSDGHWVGFFTGLGAASADAFYGFIAGFGLTIISNILVSQQIILKLIGGLFLCYLGLKTALAKPAQDAANPSGKVVSAYASTFFLTVTNPMTILSFVAIFAGLGLGSSNNYGDAGILVLGVFLGSALWWLILVSGVSLFRDKISSDTLHWVNRMSGILIFGFGLGALFSLVIGD